VADVADDRGSDDRAHPKQPGQAGPGRGDRGGGFLPGLADRRVNAAQVLGRSSAASSQRAAATAPAAVIDARNCAAWPAVISPPTPPGISSHSTWCSRLFRVADDERGGVGQRHRG